MSGFTLVIIVMLIMFAAVAIVLTQDADVATIEPIEEGQPNQAAIAGTGEQPLPEIVGADEPLTESDELEIAVLQTRAVGRDEVDVRRLPGQVVQ